MSRVDPDTVRAGIGERMDALAQCRRRAAAVEDDPAARRRLALYPYLDTVEAAALYAKANPPRGRPGRKLWRGTS